MRRERITPTIFVIACVVALAYQLLISYVINPTFTKAFIAKNEDEAQLVARHITNMVMANHETLPAAAAIAAAVPRLAKEFHLVKLKVFDPNGVTIYSSAPNEVGARNVNEYFRTIVAQGHPYTALVKEGEKTLGGRLADLDLVEAYVPIMRNDRFIGALAIHYDVSGYLERHNHILFLATTLPLLLMFAFLLSVIALLLFGDRRQPVVIEGNAQPPSPHFSLFFTLISIFLVELLVMFLLREWHPTSGFLTALTDALLLALFVTPLLYLFINRPLLRHIAERRKIEEALRESQERFHDLFENTTDLIQSIAPDGRFLYVNPAWRRALGYEEEELKELHLADILAPEETAHCQAAFAEVLSGKQVDKVETVFIAKDGRRVSVEGNASAKLTAGKPEYTRAIFHDITARKQAEADMERLIAELQKSLTEVKTLSGLLPICSWCKKIRDDKGYWNQLESYISQHSGVDFSHGVCPDCLRKHYPELLEEEKKKD